MIAGVPDIAEREITQDMAIQDVNSEIVSPNEYIKFYCYLSTCKNYYTLKVIEEHLNLVHVELNISRSNNLIFWLCNYVL
jgi:hypothetical protein